jgi:hypothetical protein
MLKFEQIKLAARLGLDEDSAEKDPRIVGGMQPLYCAVCGKEVAANDSYHLSLSGERLHLECFQRAV